MPTPPVLAYARHHGLCIDHEAEDVLRLLDVLTPIPEDDDLADPKHTALDLQQFKVDLEEPKIQLTREEGILLAKNIRPPSDFQVNWSDFLPDPRRKQKMKLEVPILTTDHDQDMEEFRKLPFSEDFEKDWADVKSGKSLSEVNKMIESEKLVVTRETMLNLSKILKVEWTEEDKKRLYHQPYEKAKQKPQSQFSTPVLSPQDSPSPVASSHSNASGMKPGMEVLEGFLLDAEESMTIKPPEMPGQAEDSTVYQDNETLQIFDVFSELSVQPAKQDKENKSAIEGRSPNIARDRLKTKTPALSQSMDNTNDEPQHRIPVEDLGLGGEDVTTVPKAPGTPSGDFGLVKRAQANNVTPKCKDLMGLSDNDLDADFMEFIDTAALSMDGIIAQEKTPTLHNYQKPRYIAPNQNQLETQEFNGGDESIKLMLLDGDDGDVENEVAEETEPITSVFWSATKTVPSKRAREHDVPAGEQSLVDGRGKLNPPTQHSEPITVEQSWNVEGEPSRRKRLRKQTGEHVASAQTPKTGEAAPAAPAAKELSTLKQPVSRPLKSEWHESGFSASGALDTFLQLRGGKYKGLLASKDVSDLELKRQPVQSRSRLTQKRKSMDHDSHFEVQVPRTPSQESDIDEPSPGMRGLEWARSIVVNSTMLKSYRALARMLDDQASEPNSLTAIYRDMREPTSGGRDDSPDMILNPRTCLIYSNIQALSQKKLPGTLNARVDGFLHDRIERLSHQFDQVCIIVTVPMPAMGQSQALIQTMNQFSGFCSGFASSKVTPTWITAQCDTRIDNLKLNQWTWGLIVQHAYPVVQCSPEDLVLLIHDETLWEVFLVRAGLNPMAAQVVVGTLKRKQDGQPWGLRKFVQMNSDQRMEMFGDVLGGRAVERINVVIDGKWTRKGWDI